MKQLNLKIINRLQKGYPLCKKPYEIIAMELNIVDEKILLDIIRKMIKNKIIRRTGVTLSHYKLGLKFNAMVVWNVNPDKVERVGKIIARFPFVSHCYERKRLPDFQYNLYSMVHARTEVELNKNINKIADTIKIKDYSILNSLKEFKKTRPDYRSGF